MKKAQVRTYLQSYEKYSELCESRTKIKSCVNKNRTYDMGPEIRMSAKNALAWKMLDCGVSLMSFEKCLI